MIYTTQATWLQPPETCLYSLFVMVLRFKFET